MLAKTELVDLPPDKILAIGLQKLKEEQDFADAAKNIDPKKPAIEVFKEIQNEHPKPEKLISDVAKDLDQIRNTWSNIKSSRFRPRCARKSRRRHSSIARRTFASMDTPGPFEKKATQAYYYVTPVERIGPTSRKTNG